MRRKEIVSSVMSHVHKGFGVVRPYLHGPADLPEFLQKTFNAVELESNEDGPTLLQIGDSLLWIEAGDLPPHVSPWVGSIYVYVEDVDTVYGRAIQFEEPETALEQFREVAGDPGEHESRKLIADSAERSRERIWFHFLRRRYFSWGFTPLFQAVRFAVRSSR